MYRKFIKYLRENNIVHHTYQPKEEYSFRIVMKHLHHSSDTQEIVNILAKNDIEHVT